MARKERPRWIRPLIWALLALSIGAILGLLDRAEADVPPLVPVSERADRVVVEKAARTLTLMRGADVIATYDVALGFSPEGAKLREGDGKTPEGLYRIDRRNDRSKFYLSLGIDYPRPDERAAARAEGRDPGGDIFIHGQPHRQRSLPALAYDWTAGCIAVSNREIEEIWSRVAVGTVVEIRP